MNLLLLLGNMNTDVLYKCQWMIQTQQNNKFKSGHIHVYQDVSTSSWICDLWLAVQKDRAMHSYPVYTYIYLLIPFPTTHPSPLSPFSFCSSPPFPFCSSPPFALSQLPPQASGGGSPNAEGARGEEGVTPGK
jgi:hypothetical protein